MKARTVLLVLLGLYLLSKAQGASAGLPAARPNPPDSLWRPTFDQMGGSDLDSAIRNAQIVWN